MAQQGVVFWKGLLQVTSELRRKASKAQFDVFYLLCVSVILCVSFSFHTVLETES